MAFVGSQRKHLEVQKQGSTLPFLHAGKLTNVHGKDPLVVGRLHVHCMPGMLVASAKLNFATVF